MNSHEWWKRLEKHGTLYNTILEHYEKEIVGQDHVKRLMAKVLSDIHQDLDNQKGKPLSILFFKGPTGVGKTEFVKQTAELLFGDKLWFVAINCEQLRQEHEWSATLFGSPKWYVWYGEAPLLDPKYIYSSWINGQKNDKLHKIATNKTHLNIILFDEIEKMHPKTIQSLLSMLDEWVINLKNGKTAYFNNSIIIFTSNVWESDAQQSINSVGFGSQSQQDEERKKDIKDKAFEQTFSPEFKGRLDHVIEFEPLQANFIDLLLSKYKKNLISDVLSLTRQKIMVQYSPDFNEYLKKHISNDKWYRNIDKVWDREVRNAVGTVIKIHRLQNYLNKHILDLFIENNDIEFKLSRELAKEGDLAIVNEHREIEWYTNPIKDDHMGSDDDWNNTTKKIDNPYTLAAALPIEQQTALQNLLYILILNPKQEPDS